MPDQIKLHIIELNLINLADELPLATNEFLALII